MNCPHCGVEISPEPIHYICPRCHEITIPIPKKPFHELTIPEMLVVMYDKQRRGELPSKPFKIEGGRIVYPDEEADRINRARFVMQRVHELSLETLREMVAEHQQAMYPEADAETLAKIRARMSESDMRKYVRLVMEIFILKRTMSEELSDAESRRIRERRFDLELQLDELAGSPIEYESELQRVFEAVQRGDREQLVRMIHTAKLWGFVKEDYFEGMPTDVEHMDEEELRRHLLRILRDRFVERKYEQ